MLPHTGCPSHLHIRQVIALMVFAITCPALHGVSLPDWITNPGASYPESMYLCGVGTGSDLPAAEKKALASIAAYFETRVSALSTLTDSERSISSRQESSSTLRSDFTRQITTSSTADIQYSRTANVWQDPSTKEFYALVVVERDKAASLYLDKITDYESALKQWLSPTTDPLQNLAGIMKASIATRDNLAYYAYYNALAVDIREPRKVPVNLVQMDQILADARKAVMFNITVNGTDDGQIATAIRERIQKSGYGFAEQSQLQIIVEISEGDSRILGKQTFASVSAIARVRNASAELLTVTDKSQQGDIDLFAARKRSLKAISNSLPAKLEKALQDYIANL